MPVCTEPPMPRLYGSVSTRAPFPSATSVVRSPEPSSTTTISKPGVELADLVDHASHAALLVVGRNDGDTP